ncbi:ArsR family transcriptional regulator [Devosia sp. Root436]|jgi:DNA-binding transcriptional ArsR family regulator|uniref:ArsR/SmtB family transcription factor n=1 Tax=Devosia sp. Root436 TaxID=1736537 RepID=UPI0006FEC85D|nr:metalloregulator ArsR/SmtB family transcription factor [Devosia sp. Root436]KQX42041.1 ArsR family transcriptional regulator [Devosia sp. Root436]
MADTLSTTLAALADPTRRAILARLAQGEASVNELAEPFDMTLAAVSKHIKVLEGAGLVSRGRQAQWRPCKLEAAPMRDVAAMVEFYRRFWEQNLDQLDAYLTRLQTPENKTKN